jgi:hypothetical protein
MELSERCLFSNPQPTRHRRRYAVQPSAQLHCANLLLLCHRLNLPLAVDDIQNHPAPGMHRSPFERANLQRIHFVCALRTLAHRTPWLASGIMFTFF